MTLKAAENLDITPGLFDPGIGLAAVWTSLTADQIPNPDPLHDALTAALGAPTSLEALELELDWEVFCEDFPAFAGCQHLLGRGEYVEVSRTDAGAVWLVVKAGGDGISTADRGEIFAWHQFGNLNRRVVMKKVEQAIRALYPKTGWGKMLQISHASVDEEPHPVDCPSCPESGECKACKGAGAVEKTLTVLRDGWIPARNRQLGLVELHPDATLIVQGLGDKATFASCPASVNSLDALTGRAKVVETLKYLVRVEQP